MRRALLLMAAVAAVAAAGSSPALAQTRPSNATFLELRPDPARGQRLDVTVSSAAGYDKDTSLEDRGLGGIGLQGPAGQTMLLTGNFDYALLGSRTQFRATAASTTRYYGSLEHVVHSADDDASRAAAVGFLYHTPSTTFVVNQTANYASSLLFTFVPNAGAITPGAGLPATADYGLSDSEIYVYTSATDYTRRLSTRNYVSATLGWQRSDIMGGTADDHRLNVYNGRAAFAHHSTRNLTLMGGYVVRTGDVAAGRLVPFGQKLDENGAEGGFDYRRPLSATRGFMMQARLGASMIHLPAVVGAAGDGSRARRYEQFSGQFTTTYDFNRTWQVTGGARRGLEYVSGLGQPVLADSITARIDGLLARRVDLRVAGAYSAGESALSGVPSLFDTYTANARVRYGLTRTWAVYGEYLYYFYDSRGTPALVPGLPPRYERNGVRAGFTLRVPAVGK